DVKYCGVNHLDIWARQGLTPKKIRLPHISGCDIVGNVRSGSPHFKAGDRVMVYPGAYCGACAYCRAGRQNLCAKFAIIGGLSSYDGGYAEQVCVPARNAIRLPASIGDEEAAALAVSYLTSWNMLRTNGASKGKIVLVYGATGGVGMAAIQLAKALGATVATTVSSKTKQDFASRLGADRVIDRSSQNVAEQVEKMTGGTGVDIVIDHVGASTWRTSIAVLKHGGRMAVCGMTSGNEATVPVRTFYTKQIAMAGALLGTKGQLIELVGFVTRKKIRPAIDSILPLERAAEAQAKMEAGRQMGKILLKCS
ncbi:MAG: zinc-binding dehydrogenase, partial [Nitrososphaera sp.]